MGLLSSIFGKKDKDDEKRSSAAKPDFGNVSSGASSTAREVPKPAPAPGPPPPTGSTAGGGKTYEIQKGDTLSAIAQRHYGKASEWRRIHEANRDVIKDPDKIYPGQKITIPDA